MHLHHAAFALAVVPFLTASLLAQTPHWIRKDVRSWGGGQPVYDAARDRVVMVGDGTWEWDGVGWTRRVAATEPPDRGGRGLAYDAARRRVVLFGGGFPPSAETWEWDGVDWVDRTAAVAPPPALGHHMTYDAARQRTVLFTDGGETWEWDGATWLRRQPATSPPPRLRGGMAYDALRQRVVLHGGIDANFTTWFADTWEWDGTNWTQGPQGPQRSGQGMAFDPMRGRVVVQGGTDASFTFFGDTWEYDGTAWTQHVSTAAPPALSGAGLVADVARQQLLLFGGQVGDLSLRTDTWARRCTNGCATTTWQLVRGSSMPVAERGFGLVFDAARGVLVAFGGTNNGNPVDETWEWDGNAWTQRSPSVRPPSRVWTTMSFDAARGNAVLFGGTDFLASLGDTWLWNGAGWTQSNAQPAPPARDSAAMAYDAARQEAVLFGGIDGPTNFADTWTWNGIAWTQRMPAHQPPARIAHAMADDAVRARVVLFGGFDPSFQALGDTWLWDGTDWTQAAPLHAPAARVGHAMAFDPNTNRVLLTGGEDGSGFTFFGDAWEWDGTDWLQVPAGPGLAPQARAEHGMAADTRANRVVVVNGYSFDVADPLWIRSTERAAAATAYGAGCGGVAGAPRIAGYGRPFLGAERFGVEVLADLPNGACAIGFAPRPGSVPFGPCTVLIGDPIVAFLAQPIPAGFRSPRVAIPFDPIFRGIDLFAQAFVLDAAGPSWQLAFSHGLRIAVGE